MLDSLYKQTLEVSSNQGLWNLFDKKLDYIFIHKFVPNEALEWWKTDLKTKSGVIFNDFAVRNMEMDIQTDLDGLKRIIELNTRSLRVYQFDRPIPHTFELENLSPNNYYQIAAKNGLRHCFFINFEFVRVGSFDSGFINNLQ